MGYRKEIQIGLVIAIVAGILALMFSLWISIVILSGVLLVVSVTPSNLGRPNRWLMLRLMLVLAGLGYLWYGMWSSYILQTTSGGFGSYSWVLAQANVLMRMFSLGMGLLNS